MRKTMNITTFSLMVALCLSATEVSAQASNKIMYQGRLTDKDGAPVKDSVEVRFAIMTTESGDGETLFETIMIIEPDINGIFTVELGPLDPGIFDGKTCYLSITPEYDKEMLPRQPLGAVPYALSTGNIPGIAYNNTFEGFLLTDSVKAVDSVTVTAPSSGFIVIQATGYFQLAHISAKDESWVRASIANTPHSLNYENLTFFSMGDAPSSSYCSPFSIITAVPVSAGQYTYYLTADRGNSAGINTYINRTHLLATYYPKAYGNVAVGKITSNQNQIISEDKYELSKEKNKQGD